MISEMDEVVLTIRWWGMGCLYFDRWRTAYTEGDISKCRAYDELMRDETGDDMWDFYFSIRKGMEKEQG